MQLSRYYFERFGATFLLVFIAFSFTCFSQNDLVLNKPLVNQTVTYAEAISFYEQLSNKYSTCKLIKGGPTDEGKNLHLFVITNDGKFDTASINKNNKVIVFINNGIHAGEPCGVDASLKLAQDLLTKPAMQLLLNKVVVCIVPFYNIDGALNRSCCSRANQNGPEQYGFRANAQNLDLNRDMIKCDALVTQSLITFYQQWKPEIFIDTHISDGADYSYTMTLIATQHNKLHPILGKYLNKEMMPALYESMKQKKQEMCPYVDTYKATPDSGLVAFLETPRFTTGYTTLFNSIGFVTEAHMLKPYAAQVNATYQILQSILEIANKDYLTIKNNKKLADNEMALTQKVFDFNWVLDTLQHDFFEFKGYEAGYKKSEISNLNRLYYNQQKPYVKNVKYYNTYFAKNKATVPKAFVIPQAWREAIAMLKLNGVTYNILSNDTIIQVKSTYIDDYKTVAKPYEGHYLHNKVSCHYVYQNIQFYKGDVIIYCNQKANRFIMETLELQAEDSYFNWNFFDSALQQKEWFSDYVYEEKAVQILKENPQLKTALDVYIKTNKFENNHWEHLAWIFKHSTDFETSAMRYPVYCIE